MLFLICTCASLYFSAAGWSISAVPEGIIKDKDLDMLGDDPNDIRCPIPRPIQGALATKLEGKQYDWGTYFHLNTTILPGGVSIQPLCKGPKYQQAWNQYKPHCALMNTKRDQHNYCIEFTDKTGRQIVEWDGRDYQFYQPDPPNAYKLQSHNVTHVLLSWKVDAGYTWNKRTYGTIVNGVNEITVNQTQRQSIMLKRPDGSLKVCMKICKIHSKDRCWGYYSYYTCVFINVPKGVGPDETTEKPVEQKSTPKEVDPIDSTALPVATDKVPCDKDHSVDDIYDHKHCDLVCPDRFFKSDNCRCEQCPPGTYIEYVRHSGFQCTPEHYCSSVVMFEPKTGRGFCMEGNKQLFDTIRFIYEVIDESLHPITGP